MIDYIKGILAEKSPSRAVIEAAGVGYEMGIPLSTYEKLPNINEQTKLFTHYHVREDAHKLFGFRTVDERMVFRELIAVSQIGPKVGLSVLSGVSVADIAHSVSLGDDSRLRSVPGIGPKTAQRLVMELKGKFRNVSSEPGSQKSVASKSSVNAPVRNEAFEAMLALGYADKQVVAALGRVEKVIGSESAVEEWIRKALQVI